MDKNLENGFIALTSTIIVAAVLLILVVSISSSGFYGRFSILDSELKEVSRGLAEGCVHSAVLKYAQDDGYVGDENTNPTIFPDVVAIGDKDCSIQSLFENSGVLTIQTQSSVKSVYTNLEVEVLASDYTVQNWEEVPNF